MSVGKGVEVMVGVSVGGLVSDGRGVQVGVKVRVADSGVGDGKRATEAAAGLRSQRTARPPRITTRAAVNQVSSGDWRSTMVDSTTGGKPVVSAGGSASPLSGSAGSGSSSS